MHDCWPFTGHCGYFDFNRCNKWESECKKCNFKSNYPRSWILSNSFKNFKKKKLFFSGINNLTIVTPSLWLSQIVKRSFLGQYDVVVINNGIDKSVFKKINSKIDVLHGLYEKKIVLGVASRWDYRKGVEDFGKLAQILPNDYQIVMIGITKKEARNLPHNVLCISRTSNVKELVEWYSVSSVFVNPTREDNYPTVNLEAQACELPVITYNTGGSVESVICSNIVEQGNIDALKNRIINVVKNGSELFDVPDVSDFLKAYMSLFLIND